MQSEQQVKSHSKGSHIKVSRCTSQQSDKGNSEDQGASDTGSSKLIVVQGYDNLIGRYGNTHVQSLSIMHNASIEWSSARLAILSSIDTSTAFYAGICHEKRIPYIFVLVDGFDVFRNLKVPQCREVTRYAFLTVKQDAEDEFESLIDLISHSNDDSIHGYADMCRRIVGILRDYIP